MADPAGILERRDVLAERGSAKLTLRHGRR
jgi:hypothetical protein